MTDDALLSPLRTSVLRAALEGGRFGVDIRRFGIVDSTQHIARDLDARGTPDGTVVVADGQTAGRGRRGHGWASPPGTGIYVSVVLAKPSDARLFAAACATALSDAARAFGVSGGIKWPNDLVVDDRKCGGALVESSSDAHVVAGFGLNLRSPTATTGDEAPVFPPGGLFTTAPSPGRERLVVELLRALERRAAQAETDPRGLCAAFSERDVLRGRHVRIEADNGVAEGIWTSSHPIDGVVLTLADGKRAVFRAEWARVVAVAPRSGDG